MEHIAISNSIHPLNIVNILHALNVHSQSFQAVRNFYSYRFNINTAYLLEVSELSNFHAIQPYFPPHAPRTQGRRFPIVFYETNIMLCSMNTKHFQALQIQFLDVLRRWLHNNLKLMVLEQTVRIVTITTISRTSGRLNITNIPR